MSLGQQTLRVLHALERAGDRGITQVDFQPPDVIDGGKPVTRVAARIHDLEEAGYSITAGERRQKCVVYRLVGAASEQQAPGDPLPPPEGIRAHVPAPPRPAYFGEHHVCERCHHRWSGDTWVRACPNCRAKSMWIASFATPFLARTYKPLSPAPMELAA